MRLARPLLALLALPLAACGGEPEPALRVGEVAFGEEQVSGLDAEARRLLADLAGLGAAVASGGTDSLAAALARAEGERARLRALPYHLAARAQGITEERLHAAYREHPEWELRVRHVVRLVPRGSGAAQREAARGVAAEVERRARAGEPFGSLAAAFSEEPGAAERGGLLEPGREGSWVEPFWQAALALQPGEISPVVETEYGFHVLRLEGRRPVPWEEASRLPVLRRLIPDRQAVGTMEAWVEERPAVALDPPAVLAARAALPLGRIADSLVLARAPSGDVYAGRDLALAWAALSPERRAELLGADDATFGWWVENDAREALWSAEARRLGAEVPRGVQAEAEARWRGKLAGWAAGLGFRPGLSAAEVAARALAALTATDQEARIARAELPSLRPLLRSVYPASEAGADSSASSSEMRNRESTR